MQLSGIEIVDVAKKIESFGVAFYDEAAKRAKSTAVRALFELLRNEETKHQRAFEKLLTTMDDDAYQWRQNDEYLVYMTALAEDLVFPEANVARKIATELVDERAALKRALDFEKESILYFSEMRTAVREEDQHILTAIIDEERKHLQMLTELLSKTEP